VTAPAVRPKRIRVSLVSVRSGKARAGTLQVGLGLIGIVVLASAIGHFVLVPPDQQDLTDTLAPVSWSHPFGTDALGRDVLSRTLAATWLDLSFAIGVTVVAVGIGLIIGLLAGAIGGPLEHVTMRVVDAVIAFPYLVLVLAVITIIGPASKGW
jgi:peptide/nickel transport system permease protein